MTSWILTNVAALYWRVEGDAKKAVDCLRMSLTTAPKEKRVGIIDNSKSIKIEEGYYS